MKTTMIILLGAILLLIMIAIRFQPAPSTDPTPAEWFPGQAPPMPVWDTNQVQFDLTYEQLFDQRKQLLMTKYNSFVAQIYRHKGHGELVFHCLGTMISDSTLITSKECATSQQTLLIVFKCHKLDDQYLPSENSRIVQSEVTNLITIGPISLISVHPSRPSERCVVLWTREDLLSD